MSTENTSELNDATGDTGKRIIFLISQPRAGSTMLQRMLAVHSDICTTAEPWLLLAPASAARVPGPGSSLQDQIAAAGVQAFANALPHGTRDYLAALRSTYGHLYSLAADAAGKRYFLDKTPRYTCILPELKEVFPEAKFIVLLRNPLAVLVSIVNTWGLAKVLRLHRFEWDLLDAPGAIASLLEDRPGTVVSVRYEDLLLDPEAELRRLCGDLGLVFEPAMLKYGEADLPRWELGDQARVYEFDAPREENRDAWSSALRSAQVWRLCRDYLDHIGPDTMKVLGYSYAELDELLCRARPSPVRILFTLPLSLCVRGLAPKLRAFKYQAMYYLRRMRDLGPLGSVRALGKKLGR